jgi:hypothetical protein
MQFDDIDGRPTKMQWNARNTVSNEFIIDTIERSKFEYDVEYRFNKEGFRMDEDLSEIVEPCVVYLGDSTTMGYAINLEDTWAYKHHQRYHAELKYVNLGNATCGVETCHRLASYWLPKLNVKNVYFLQPASNRQEFMNDDAAYMSAVWSTKAVKRMGGKTEFSDLENFEDKLFLDYVSNVRHQKWLTIRVMDALRHILAPYEHKICHQAPAEMFGKARDGMHASPEQQDEILKLIETN